MELLGPPGRAGVEPDRDRDRVRRPSRCSPAPSTASACRAACASASGASSLWYSVLAVVLVVGRPRPDLGRGAPRPAGQRGGLARRRRRSSHRLERRLPHGAMVFQLPVTDFPEHGAGHRMSDHDLIKETYLHSTTLRWSAGGIRGRSTEWQWPASPTQAARSCCAASSRWASPGVMLDRSGYADDAAPRGARDPPLARARRRPQPAPAARVGPAAGVPGAARRASTDRRGPGCAGACSSPRASISTPTRAR